MRQVIMFVVLLGMGVSTAWAEQPIKSKERLRQEATHIVVGTVLRVYSDTSKVGDWESTDWVAAIKVERAEKGKRIKRGDVVYAKCWNKQWIGEGIVPPHASGHHGIPQGKKLIAYLKRQDGAYAAILPNWFEMIAEKKADNGRRPAPEKK